MGCNRELVTNPEKSWEHCFILFILQLLELKLTVSAVAVFGENLRPQSVLQFVARTMLNPETEFLYQREFQV